MIPSTRALGDGGGVDSPSLVKGGGRRGNHSLAVLPMHHDTTTWPKTVIYQLNMKNFGGITRKSRIIYPGRNFPFSSCSFSAGTWKGPWRELR